MPIWKMKRRSILTKRPFRKIRRRFANVETPFWFCFSFNYFTKVFKMAVIERLIFSLCSLLW